MSEKKAGDMPAAPHKNLLFYNSGLLAAYITGMSLSIIIFPIFGVIVALTAWIVVSWGFLLLQKGIVFTQEKLWGKAIVTLFFPVVLWGLFGVGGMVALILPDQVTDFGRDLQPIAILLFMVYALLGGTVYQIVVTVLLRGVDFRRMSGVPVSFKRLQLFAFIILLYDWYIRLDRIRDGVYFTWLQGYSQVDARAIGPTILYQLQQSLGALIIPLFVYLEAKTGRTFYRIIIFLHLFLIFLRGSRTDILVALLMFIMSKAIVQNKKVDIFFWGRILMVGGIFLLIIGPPFQVARQNMRIDALELQRNPISIPILFVTEYMPGAMRLDSYFQNEERASVVGRVGSYMAYAASIQQAVLDGYDVLPGQIRNVVTGVLPRFLFQNKPVLDADAFVQSEFGFDNPERDATGTAIADIFAYLHFPGILLLSILVAVLFSLIARLFNRYGMMGELIMLGLASVSIPVLDSVGHYLAIMRNLVLIVLLILLFTPHSQWKIPPIPGRERKV